MYLPAESTQGGLGRDWHDAVALPSGRVALIIGDAAGRDPAAAATMARLRTAALRLAERDCEPDELLARLDDLVRRLTAEAEPDHEGAAGSTCLYARYDPRTRRCAVASAGHPPPAVIQPDGAVGYVHLVPRPPLGLTGPDHGAVEVELTLGSILALYTDGLIRHTGEPGAGMADLRERLAPIRHHVADLGEAAARLISELPAGRPPDDATLLLARSVGEAGTPPPRP